MNAASPIDRIPPSQTDEATRQIPVAGNRMDSTELFRLSREILITHGGETYRLRLTSQNKLILTK